MSKYTVSQRIDCNGPDGNVFNLIGLGRNWLKQLGHKDQQGEFSKQMMSSDYKNALNTMLEWFGDCVYGYDVDEY